MELSTGLAGEGGRHEDATSQGFSQAREQIRREFGLEHRTPRPGSRRNTSAAPGFSGFAPLESRRHGQHRGSARRSASRQEDAPDGLVRSMVDRGRRPKGRRAQSLPSGRYFGVELDGPVGFCAAADLSPPLAGGGRPRHDHQVSVEMLQDLDLGALGISPPQRIQSLQFGHDPRRVEPGRRDDRGLLDGRPLLSESRERRLNRPQFSPDSGRVAPVARNRTRWLA
jgi:hypothetical protein